jgi:hypothetical protein
MKALRLPTRVSTVAYLFRFRSPCVPPHSCLAAALREDRRSLPGQGLCLCRRPLLRLLRMDASRISQVFRRSILCLCCVPGPRSNRRVLTMYGHVDAAPTIPTVKASALGISGLTRSFSTCCRTLHARRCHRTCKACFRLAGWPLPGGSRTLWITTKGFSSLDHPPFLLS